MRVPVDGPFAANSSIALRDAAIAGRGLALLPAFYLGEALRKRQPRSVLDAHTTAPLFLYAVYQRSRHLSAKVRSFVEYLREHFSKANWAVSESSR